MHAGGGEVTGQPPVGSSQDADPGNADSGNADLSRAPAARRRSATVWAALAWLVLLGLWKASLALYFFSGTIRHDQVHVGSVPGYLWVIFALLVAAAVLDVVMGVLIFRGVRWAWGATLVVVAVGYAPGLSGLSANPSAGARAADVAIVVAVLLAVANRAVRDWCRPPAARDAPGE
jgi:hypothetical protein